MAKFAATAVPPQTVSPVRSTGLWVPTHEGARGYERDPKSELFLLAVSNLVGEDLFYETGKAQDSRFAGLVHQVTADDPGWVARLVRYLRHDVYLRSCPLVMAAEYVKAGGPDGRAVVSSALDRADEPAEMLAYWVATHGRSVPKAVKRGVADAVVRLYDERAALRWDSQGHAWRMGDVIDLVHPTPKAPWQGDLFRWLLDRRHNRSDARMGDGLPTLAKDHALQTMPASARREALRDGKVADAGWGWERLSGWLPGGMDAEAWEAVMPAMGYMAQIRNLRNFDEAGVSDEAAARVAARLSDPAEVERSRQMPMRFLSAWKATQSMRWGAPLEKALSLSLNNIPRMPGRTLVMVDTSGSMMERMSAKSDLLRWEAAAVFGVALATRNDADLVAFGSDAWRIKAAPGASVLRVLDDIRSYVGGGTYTWPVLRSTYAGHDRVVILTDEQASWDIQGEPTVAEVPLIFTFNLAGYPAGHLPSGRDGRHTFGGLTDSCFQLINLIDRQRDGSWPF